MPSTEEIISQSVAPIETRERRTEVSEVTRYVEVGLTSDGEIYLVVGSRLQSEQEPAQTVSRGGMVLTGAQARAVAAQLLAAAD